MNSGRAFLAGMAGGVVMTVITWMARTFTGMPMNLEMMEGTMLVPTPGTLAWGIGFVMHLMISGLIALLYAWAFEHVVHRAGAGIGAAFGLVHAVVAGLVMGMMPSVHPLIPGVLDAPGAFLSSIPMGVVALFVLHAIYGALVGAVYAPVFHRVADHR